MLALKNELYGRIQSDATLFDFIQQTAFDGLCYWDLENQKNVWFNDAFLKTLGYTSRDFEQDEPYWDKIVHPDDVDRLQQRLEAYLQRQEPHFEHTARYCCANGQVKWLRTRGLLLYENDIPKRLLGTHMDVTEEKQATETARNDLAIYKSILDNQSVYILKIDLNGNYSFVNDAYCKTFDWAPDQIIGKSSLLGIVEEDQPKCANIGHMAFAQPGRVFKETLRKVLPNGEIATGEWEFKALNDAQGNSLELLAVGMDISEKVAAFEQLKSSEEQFRFIAESISDGIAVYYRETPVYFSPTYEKIMGYPIQMELKRTAAEMLGLFHPDDVEEVLGVIAHAKKYKLTEFSYTYRARHAMGHYVWREDMVGVTYGEDDQFEKVVVIARDITTRKIAEQQLQEERELLKTIIDNIPINIYVKDLASRKVLVNKAEADFCGQPPEALLGKDLEDLYPEAVASVLRREDEHVMRSGEPLFHKETLIARKDGAAHWFQVSKFPLREASGAIKGLVGISYDLTDRKAMEMELLHSREELRQSEEAYRMMVENTRDLVWMQNLEGYITYASASWEEATGFKPAQVVGRHFSEMIHPMHLPLAMAYIQKLLTTGNTHEQMEYLAMHSNGEYCWYQGGGKILKAADGQVTGFIGSSRNIHQEKLAKKAQQESAELLAKLSEQVPGAIYQFRRKPDGSFDFPYVSKGITSILPVTPQECMQDIMAFFGYVHPDDLNPLMHSIQQSYENQSEWQQEYRVICTEKGLRWMRGHSQPELQPDGSTIWHGFLEDVTTNKQAEEVLAQTSQQLSSIFTAMSDVVWALSMPDNKPLFITPSVEALYGITHHEFMTDETYWHRVIHPDDMWAKESILSDLAQHGQFACEYRIITASQQVKWVLNRGRTIYDEQGQAIRVDGMISDITTRKNMEIALQHTSEMLEETSKLAKIGGWSYDPAINVVYWSDITKEIHEVSADYQPDPDKAVEFYKEGYYRNRIMACLKACVEHGTPYDEEFLFITAKDREIWVRSVGKAEFKNGRCVRLYGTYQDIDDRKRAEIAYLRAKELLEQTGSTAKVGGWEYDFMHKKIYWTNSLKEIHEVGRDFEPSSSYHALLQQFYPEPGQIEKIKEILQQSLLKQEPYDHELLLTTAKGRKKWIRALGKPVFEQGKCIRMFGTVQDIDDRKHAEAEMRMLESVVKHTKDSVLITEAEPFDLPGPKIVYVNEAFSRMTGYTPEEIIGKTPRILQGPKSDRETLKRVREALRNWESFEVELINYKKNGEEYWVNFSVVPVADHTGWYTHWIAIERDITEQKHNEERLIQAKEQAEAANRAKSEFLANMSHEIRTPLNSVIGFTDLLVRTRLDDVQRQYMQTVHQSANSLLDLINDILDFSKIEAGKLELSLEKTDLWDLASQVADIVKFKTAEKKLELLLNISPHLPRFAWVDPVRLRQILVNLLSNAVKFTHEGEIEIGIALLPAKQKDKASIEFSVRDTGIGIAPDKQDKIFEAFTQEDTSTTRKYGGTGLGLTISNKLLLLMDSKLELHSTQTEGSRFFFHLEVTTEEGVPENWEVLRQMGKVLIVDDNENNCRILQEMLALQGIASDTANSGLLALDMVMRRSGYGVAIVDYHMPLIDGLEVIEKIRKKLNITAAQLPIVLLHSAADDQHINAACREFQVHAQLNKPITLKRLFQTLARLFDQNVLQEAQVPEQPKLCADAQYTVLVADDNEFNQMLAKNMILQLLPGATVIEAANGKEAVEKYHALAPDLILMDIQMPEMSGYEAASEIRKAHGRRVPIIALTAGTVKGEKERCLEAGMDDYLSKPIVLDRLHMALLEWLAPENQGIPTERQGTQAASKEKLRFNRSSLLKRLGNNEEVLAEIMVLFREKTLVQMPLQVEEALQEGKTVEEIRSIAHSIKGASQGAGFEILAALAAKLEYMEPWDHSHALLLLDSIKVEIVAIKEVIEKAE